MAKKNTSASMSDDEKLIFPDLVVPGWLLEADEIRALLAKVADVCATDGWMAEGADRDGYTPELRAFKRSAERLLRAHGATFVLTTMPPAEGNA
jgi:hypothetical protein